MGAGAVGAVGAGMVGAGAIAAPMSAAASAPAGAPAAVGSTQLGGISLTSPLGSAMPAGLDNLINALQGFSTAEILLALMMLGGGQDDKKKTPDAAIGLLAGLALAGQLGGFTAHASNASQGIAAANAAAGGGVGVQINFQV